MNITVGYIPPVSLKRRRVFGANFCCRPLDHQSLRRASMMGSRPAEHRRKEELLDLAAQLVRNRTGSNRLVRRSAAATAAPTAMPPATVQTKDQAIANGVAPAPAAIETRNPNPTAAAPSLSRLSDSTNCPSSSKSNQALSSASCPAPQLPLGSQAFRPT